MEHAEAIVEVGKCGGPNPACSCEKLNAALVAGYVCSEDGLWFLTDDGLDLLLRHPEL